MIAFLGNILSFKKKKMQSNDNSKDFANLSDLYGYVTKTSQPTVCFQVRDAKAMSFVFSQDPALCGLPFCFFLLSSLSENPFLIICHLIKFNIKPI